jgi:hypothetical protein
MRAAQAAHLTVAQFAPVPGPKGNEVDIIPGQDGNFWMNMGPQANYPLLCKVVGLNGALPSKADLATNDDGSLRRGGTGAWGVRRDIYPIIGEAGQARAKDQAAASYGWKEGDRDPKVWGADTLATFDTGVMARFHGIIDLVPVPVRGAGGDADPATDEEGADVTEESIARALEGQVEGDDDDDDDGGDDK